MTTKLWYDFKKSFKIKLKKLTIEEILQDDFEKSFIKKVHKFLSKSSCSDAFLEEVLLLIRTTAEDLTNYYNKTEEDGKRLTVPVFLSQISLAKAKTKIRRMSGLHYIAPQEVILGRRFDQRNVNGVTQTVSLKDSMYYFPVKKRILSLLQDKTKFSSCLSEKCSFDEPNDGNKMYRSDLDGSRIKNLLFTIGQSNNTIVLRAVLYNDDIEPANPLGSKSGSNKLSNWYIYFQNFGTPSKLSDIYFLQTCYATDVKRYGMNALHKRFRDEMRALRSGFSTHLHNTDVKIVVVLVGVTGDTLAIHSMFIYKSPSAKVFCRCCFITRDEYHRQPTLIAEKRTKEQCNDLQLILNNENLTETEKSQMLTKFGLDSNYCILNEIEGYHITENDIWDVLHDKLEGETKLITKCILFFTIYMAKAMNLDCLNNRIRNFNYGFLLAKDKPCILDEYNLKLLSTVNLRQYAMQMWVLVRILPFIIFDALEMYEQNEAEQKQKYEKKNPDKTLPAVHEIKKLLSLHLMILRICMSPVLSEGSVTELDSLTKQQICLFSRLFPWVSLPNKIHQGLHYPDSVRAKGPLMNYWTARLEAYHRIHKQRVISAGNFICLPKTIVDQSAWSYSFQRIYPDEDENTNRLKKLVEKKILQIEFEDVIYFAGQYICFEFNETPSFGKILSMELKDRSLSFCFEIFEEVEFNIEYCGYELKPNQRTAMLQKDIKELYSKWPLDAWNTCHKELSTRKILISSKTLEI